MNKSVRTQILLKFLSSVFNALDPTCRASAKLVSALVHAYPEQIADIYSKAAGELVGRFREREENVKADVFAAYCDLLRQVGHGEPHMALYHWLNLAAGL